MARSLSSTKHRLPLMGNRVLTTFKRSEIEWTGDIINHMIVSSSDNLLQMQLTYYLTWASTQSISGDWIFLQWGHIAILSVVWKYVWETYILVINIFDKTRWNFSRITVFQAYILNSLHHWYTQNRSFAPSMKKMSILSLAFSTYSWIGLIWLLFYH